MVTLLFLFITKNKIEKILIHKFKLTNEDKEILNELLIEDNIDVKLADAIKRILNSEMWFVMF